MFNRDVMMTIYVAGRGKFFPSRQALPIQKGQRCPVVILNIVSFMDPENLSPWI